MAVREPVDRAALDAMFPDWEDVQKFKGHGKRGSRHMTDPLDNEWHEYDDAVYGEIVK